MKETENQNINRKQNDRVLIIDGLNTFYQMWSSIPTMNDDGACWWCNCTLKSMDIIRQTQPTRVVVVFDAFKVVVNEENIWWLQAQRDKNKLRVNVNMLI